MRGEANIELFDMDRHDLWRVRVLDWNVNWHGVLPFLFLFVLFFHCDAKLAASRTRVVNIVSFSGYRLFSQWLQLGL